MYLKSLTLKGFKSFAQPTTFAFEPGVTCVVGPNGSGKSNVVDALAWVMGEQGVKTLRGGKMEDVIFAGTSTKGPLGRAEVTLTIDNTDGALPIDYTEVTISRTLFRNGGSEYAINGQGCRLLDVQELLSDSGLGREMHVIVGQGQLDAVLRASPEDRRGFIEEAAGILKHRRRKEKTLRKLDAMQANLTRLSDLAGEIRRQLKPLGRQAEIAREAQTIAAVVRDARARLLADDVVGLRGTLDAHGRSESERHSERIVLQEQLDQKQLRLHRLEEAQIGDAVDVARRTSFGLESVQERLRGLYTLANQRLALLGSQSESVDAGPSVTPAMLTDAAAEIVRLTERIAVAESAWAAARAATSTARRELAAVDEDIAAQTALISRHDLEASTLRGQAETAASRLASVRSDVLRQQNARNAAAGRVQEAEALLAALEAETEQANAENAGTGTVNSDPADTGVTGEAAGNTRLSEDFESAQSVVSAAEGEVERLREELHLLERERDALAARASALSLALDQKDGSSALLGARLDGIRGLVAEHVRVHPGYEAAIAAALGSLADAVLADDSAAGFAALDRVRADDLGRVELILATPATPDADGAPADAAGGTPDRRASGAPARLSLAKRAGLVWAGSVLDAPAGVLGLLGNTVIAEDLDSALAAADLLTSGHSTTGTAATGPGAAGIPLTIITRAGDVLSEFVLRGGSGARRSKLELVADRQTAADRLGEVRSRIEQVSGDLTEQRSLLRLGKDQSVAALAALRAFDARLAAQAEKTNRATVRLEAATAELERIAAGVLVAEQTVAGAEAEAERTKAGLLTLLSRTRPILDVSVRDALHAELEAAREHEVEARLRVETARERVRSGEARAAGLARQLERDQAAAEAAARRAVIRRRQVDAATRVAEALPAVLAAVDVSVSEARLRLATAEAERQSQNEELATLRREDGALRSRLQAVTESVHGLELQIYEKKLHLSGLLERAGSELGLVEDILVSEYGPDQPVPPDDDPDGEPVAYDREQQQRRHASAERRFAQLGRINPLALEEFAALEQRHKFLTEQLTDLTNTRADLLTIIDDLDVTMGAIFGSAFEDTRLAFAEVFPVLFPGGSGSIRLTDPDDLLTTGIEISVKPAGKKIERLSLLSGGERSLAAVALLIAIFKARPSPFYIMDEVEAALDDANLGRLLTIFQDLREASQLIIITHQKRTMEIADALYGVSMRQDGVSAVVGQRIVRQEEQAS
ncbi:chromosome segregation protein SMC [Cryobacterium sp. GrIS_2_6]|uniref:chromosome segregation protein SMC n=1 Tax=Cryobacterium sp. GrIS_2_6 TaxID=3162785 RepID=UPI002E008D65|nr:chromosome segregation protein SMC [Cryobacterium psychrotolerans]MEC5149043.1 chromosome segregation protein [Cryobacterium psychrotolerans]